MTRMAIEDIGLADPRALSLALDAWQTYERLGSPEGELALAEAAVYLAVAPKSNAAYEAFAEAKADVERYGSLEVPLRFRNAPTPLMKQLGYGSGYRYAHDEPEAYAAGERYLPDEHARSQLLSTHTARPRAAHRRDPRPAAAAAAGGARAAAARRVPRQTPAGEQGRAEEKA